MEKINNEKTPETKDNDLDFLNELNNLTNQIKTDEEIIKDLKKDSKTRSSQNSNQNKNSDKNNNTNSKNSNPFQEAYNIMNSKNSDFNLFNESNTFLESIENLHSQMNQMNNLLYKTLNMECKNSENEINDNENNLMNEILDFLVDCDLLKNTISTMKKNIENSFNNSKNSLKDYEIEKYKEALVMADNILNETNKITPDKEIIVDNLTKLQQISNDVENNMFSINPSGLNV